MERLLAKVALILGLVIIGFVSVWALNRISKGTLTINLFNAVNAGLLLGLGFNVYVWITDDHFGSNTAPITVAAIVGLLVFRFWKHRKETT